MPIAVEYPQVFTPHFRVSNLGLILELIDMYANLLYLSSAALKFVKHQKESLF
jgi:hypothetical protein